MTSTSFNNGITESKPSLRVIKPPGGGHTDIFGIHGNEGNFNKSSKKKNVPEQSIKSCFMEEDITKTNNKKTTENNIVNNEEKGKHEMNEQTEVHKKSDESSKQKMDEKSQSAPPKRERVPPGGFSSQLW